MLELVLDMSEEGCSRLVGLDIRLQEEEYNLVEVLDIQLKVEEHTRLQVAEMKGVALLHWLRLRKDYNLSYLGSLMAFPSWFYSNIPSNSASTPQAYTTLLQS